MKKHRILFILLTLISIVGFAEQPLPIEKAFQFEARIHDPSTLLIQWKMPAGYYLYQNKFRFTMDDPSVAELGNILLPKATQQIEVGDGGREPIYQKQLKLPLYILGIKPGTFDLLVNYQGCTRSGFCYPPTCKKLKIQVNSDLAMQHMQIEEAESRTPKIPEGAKSDQQQLSSHVFAEYWIPIQWLLFFGLGVLLSFTPCVLPMIPIISSIILGQGNQLSTRRAFLLSLTYVLSMSFTYAIAGVVLASLGSHVQATLQHPVALLLFSVMFVWLALSMFGFYDLKLPAALESRLARISRKQHHTYIGVAIMGFLATLILSPCVTAPLVGVLGYIAETGNVWLGGSALFALGFGMGVPLIAIGTSHAHWLPKTGQWMSAVKTFFGVLLLATAIYLLTRIIPGYVALFAWSILLIIYAVSLFHLSQTLHSHWKAFWQGMSFFLLLYGSLLLIGASMGHDTPLQPLKMTFSHTQPPLNRIQSTTVTSLAEAKQALDLAKQQEKPAVLDFYASWCISCQLIEKMLFSDPQIVALLNNVHVIKVDITSNDKKAKALVNHYKVIAPPVLMFFDNQGKSLKKLTIAGEPSKTKLIDTLSQLHYSH